MISYVLIDGIYRLLRIYSAHMKYVLYFTLRAALGAFNFAPGKNTKGPPVGEPVPGHLHHRKLTVDLLGSS